MLDERRIERYARQILLPGVGGAGQERLLAASVEIHGGREDVRACAAWLAGAGVGCLALTDGAGPADPLVARNPDCRIVDGTLGTPALRIGIGALPGEPRDPGALLWGGTVGGHIEWAALASDRGCARCRDAIRAQRGPGASHRTLLAALLATEALRDLLGITSRLRAEVHRFDPSTGILERGPFPFRADCAPCREAA